MTGLMQFTALLFVLFVPVGVPVGCSCRLFLSAVPVGCSCRLFISVDLLEACVINGQQCGDARRAAE